MSDFSAGEWWIHQTGDGRVRFVFKTEDGGRAVLDMSVEDAYPMFRAGMIASSRPKSVGDTLLRKARIAQMRRSLREKGKTLPSGI